MHSLFLHPVGQKQSFKWKLTDVEDYRVWGSKKKNSEKMTADPPESLQQTRALYYIVAATVITFKLGHLKIFSFNVPKSCCDEPKSLILD